MGWAQKVAVEAGLRGPKEWIEQMACFGPVQMVVARMVET